MITREDLESFILRLGVEHEEVEDGMWAVAVDGHDVAVGEQPQRLAVEDAEMVGIDIALHHQLPVRNVEGLDAHARAFDAERRGYIPRYATSERGACDRAASSFSRALIRR